MKIYTYYSTTKPEVLFPFTKMFDGKEYYQSLANPTYVKNCTQQRAKERVAIVRAGGWAARVVTFMTQNGPCYLAYERRTKKCGRF